MKTFLDYVQQKETENIVKESFAQKDMDKVGDLIAKSLNNHCNKRVIHLSGTVDCLLDGEKMMSQQFVVYDADSKHSSYFTIDWQRTGRSNEAYSISFYTSTKPYFEGTGKSALTIYTLGNSIIYFLPVIWTVLNDENYDITAEDAIKLGREVIDTPKESFTYNVGALEYKIYENISKQRIQDTYDMTTEARGVRYNVDPELGRYKSDKHHDLDAAYRRRKDSKKAEKEWRKLKDEYTEILDAVKGGVTTLEGLKAAIKRNVQLIEEIDKHTEKLENQAKAEREDPELVFKKMEYYLKLVIKGVTPSVIICGAPGVGKTYRAKRELRRAHYRDGDNMYILKGKCTCRVLYLKLYEYRKKGDILFIDDADSLIGPKADEDTINVLKAALDNSDDDDPENPGRLVSYNVTGTLYDDDGNPIPKRMRYNGSCIILTNWNAGSLDTALRSRSFVQDINFTTEDNLLIIERLLPEILPDTVTMESKERALEYLKGLAEKGTDLEISVRTFEQCSKLYEGTKDEPDQSLAESMIREQMANQVSRQKRKY